MLSSRPVFSHLTPVTIPRRRHCHHPHCTEWETETQVYTRTQTVRKYQGRNPNRRVIPEPMPITFSLQGRKCYTQMTFQFKQTFPPAGLSPFGKKHLTLLRQGVVWARRALLVRSADGCPLALSPEGKSQRTGAQGLNSSRVPFVPETFCSSARLDSHNALPQRVGGGSGI